MNIAVIGTNDLGLSTAVLLAYMNHFVVLVDDNQAKIDLLKNNSLFHYEPNLNETVKAISNSLYFTTDLTKAIECSDAVYFVSGEGYSLSETCHIFAETISHKYRILINKSAAVPGTSGTMYDIVRAKSSNFSIAYEVPYINSGSVVADTFYPEKIVIGVRDIVAQKTIEDMYKPLLLNKMVLPEFIVPPHRGFPKMIWTDVESAELSYHAERVFNGLKSSFINELSAISEMYGAKTDELLRIMRTPGINNLQLKYGLGWSALECGDSFRTLNEVATKSNIQIPLIESALKSNYDQRKLLVAKVSAALGGLQGKRIGILGLTYRPLTDDITDSPSIDVIKGLLAEGAIVRAHDPVANFKVKFKYPDLDIETCELPSEVFENSEMIIFCTEWPEYFELDWFDYGGLMKTRMIFDARNVLPKEEFLNMGYDLLGYDG